jgi:hypothetical protein
MSEPKYKTHPSYGMIRVSRIYGGHNRLFGSPITTHPGYIQLAIASGEHRHEHGQDWFYAKQDIIRVRMSYAQFAELITTMNSASGVPCTIERLQGEMIENPPDEPIEAEKTKIEFQQKLKAFDKSLATNYESINKLLDKASLTKKDREEIKSHLQTISREIRSNIPFWLSQFDEAVERIMTTAKTEIDGFMTTVLRVAGMESLAKGTFSGLLPGKRKDEPTNDE